MYSDLEALEARFQNVLKEWGEAKSHDDKVRLAQIAKELATEYRKRVTEYKQMLKKKSSAMRNL
jgi:ElaB/YqjD/DUF883 family membrane-anchored ribosome-binding protein